MFALPVFVPLIIPAYPRADLFQEHFLAFGGLLAKDISLQLRESCASWQVCFLCRYFCVTITQIQLKEPACLILKCIKPCWVLGWSYCPVQEIAGAFQRARAS